MIDQETLHILEIEINPTIGMETIQMIEIKNIKTIDHVIVLTTDQIIKNQVKATIKTNNATIHKKEIQTITIDKENTLNHHIGITKILKTKIEATHQNIKDK